MLKRVAQAAAVALVAALLGLLIWKIATQRETKAKVGKSAPDFTLKRLDRPGTLSLSSLRGKPVVLNFWASWCGPCRDESPLLESAWKRWRSRGLVVLGINDGSEDFKSDARKFMRKYGMTYPVVRDVRYLTVTDYGVTGVPETFFVGRKGRLLEHITGAVKKDSLETGIRKVLQ
jgi:cytochrome c biogenesis protein CcmG/thiol:disulfide interchange protein DsbE